MEQATQRVISYWATFFILLIIAIVCLSGLIPIQMHSSLTHSVVQSIATIIALFVGIAALYRYYYVDVKNSMLLFLGVGFLGTSIIDAYHTIVTSSWFIGTYTSVPSSVARWSWVSTRIFLSLLLLLSLIGALRGEKGSKKINERIVYLVITALTIGALAFFFFVPLPFPMYPERFIVRPEELIPGSIFLIALIGYLRRGKWKTDNLEHWIVLCLIASVMCQFIYIPESEMVFDLMYIAAHFVKILSYWMVYMGITAI